MPEIPSAWLRPRVRLIFVPILLLAAVAWSGHHLYRSYAVLFNHSDHELAFLWALTFSIVVWHLSLSWLERPFKVSDAEAVALDALFVTVNVPVYNEDPAALRLSLQSLLAQSRPAQRIEVVNDGSTLHLGELAEIREWWRSQAGRTRCEWVDIPNGGKRHAQTTTFATDEEAEIFMTVDSDTILDRRCLEEALKPFAQADVMSVAGVILAYNNRNRFVRMTDAWMIGFQLNMRAAMSKLGCVLVNSGSCSLYRAAIVHEAIPVYRTEIFRGRRVEFSDDSLLTLIAQLRGRTVQQSTCFAFTVLPANVSHHIRQQLRWMRGSTIRSIWRFRYLPIASFGYWENFVSWLSFVLMLFAFVFIFVVGPLFGGGQLGAQMVAVSVLLFYMFAAKYLTVARSDQGLRFQLGTLLMAPLMLVWSIVVLRPLRLYSIATCHRTGWGTREKVEVAL